jgi:hypothetical protein
MPIYIALLHRPLHASRSSMQRHAWNPANKAHQRSISQQPCHVGVFVAIPSGQGYKRDSTGTRKRQPIPPRAGKASEDGAHHVAGSTTETKSPPWNVVWSLDQLCGWCATESDLITLVVGAMKCHIAHMYWRFSQIFVKKDAQSPLQRRETLPVANGLLLPDLQPAVGKQQWWLWLTTAGTFTRQW